MARAKKMSCKARTARAAKANLTEARAHKAYHNCLRKKAGCSAAEEKKYMDRINKTHAVAHSENHNLFFDCYGKQYEAAKKAAGKPALDFWKKAKK